MARTGIRYDSKLDAEINRTIRNFNNKISRLAKNNKDLILPEKITKKSLKDDYQTRAELKYKLKELQRYSSRGAEESVRGQGFITSKWEYENLKKKSANAKRSLTRQINMFKASKPTVFGKLQDATFSEMGSSQYLNLLAKRNALDKSLKNLDKQNFENYKKLVDKVYSQNKYKRIQFKANYSDMLTQLGYYTGYSADKLEYLNDKLMKVPSKNFTKLFDIEQSVKAITDYYKKAKDIFGKPEDIADDVAVLYDELIDNIDDILEPYA